MSSLTQENVKHVLQGCHLVNYIYTYSSITSTMDKAKEFALLGYPEGTLIIAEEQTMGRGRIGRKWVSPRGTLAFSILLRPDKVKIRYLSMAAGIAVKHTLQNMVSKNRVQLKWPNDVLINGRKVSGILVEGGGAHEHQYAVIGIGVNINSNSGLEINATFPATSLSNEMGELVDPLIVLRDCLLELSNLYKEQEPEYIYNVWRADLSTLGQNVKANTGKTIIQGIAEDVNQDGALIIKSQDGKRVIVASGDVMLR